MASQDSEHAAIEDQLRRERDRQEAFLASLQDGFEMLDADGTIIEVNERFAEIVGMPRDLIIGLRPPFPWWPAKGPQRQALEAALDAVVRGGSGEFDLTFRRSDGRSVDVILNAKEVRGAGGERLGVVAIVKDVSERVAAQAEREELLDSLAQEREHLAAAVRRLSQLQRFTASASMRLTQVEVLDALVEAARDVVGASGTAVTLAERAEALERVVTSGDLDPEMVPESTPVAADGSLAEAFRTGTSLWLDPRPGHPNEAARERWAFVPLVGWSGPMGVLALCCPEDAYTVDDRSLLETIVWQAAQALERARLVETEAKARERLARVLAVSDAALSWLDSEDALAALLRRVREAVGADSASLLVREGDHLRVRATDGLERIPEEQVPIPIGQGFSGRIAADREPLIAEDLPRIPVVSPWLRERLHSVVGVPILRDEEVLGVLHVGTAAPRAFDRDDVDLLTLVAARVGGALERAQLFEAARVARTETARAADRLRRLQAATVALTGRLTVAQASSTILRQAIAAVHADAGVLAVPSEDGASLDIVATAGRAATDATSPSSFPIGADTSIGEAYRSDQPVWVPTRHEWERRFPHGLGATKPWARSIFALPLSLDEHRFGSIGLMFKTEGKLSREERRLAKTFAEQAALALERAHLFEAERSAREATAGLQRFAASMAAVATAEEVLGILVEEGSRFVGAEFAWAAVVDAGAQELNAIVSHGYASEIVESFRRTSLEQRIPACDAAREAREVWFDSLADFRSEYADLEPPTEERGGGFGCVPMFDAAGRVIGVASFQLSGGTTPDERRKFDVRSVVGLAAQSLERAQLYELERTIAATLQESLLPSVYPEDARLTIATRYRPGTLELDVGGDWYDVIRITRDRIGLAVGDVVGHGIEAASAMGQLRSALRGLALSSVGPASVVEGLDRFARATAPATLATIAYAELDLASGELRYVCAGHPPPALVVGDDARLLEDGRTTPLAALLEPTPCEEGREWLPPGAVLVLYSDGLIERRGEQLDVGMRRLLDELREGGSDEPETVADRILAGLTEEVPQDDDVAVLCVRAAPTVAPFLSSMPAQPNALGRIRRDVRSWLVEAAVSDEVRDEIVLACNEACANAVEHAYAKGPTAPITVSLSRSDSSILMEVADTGTWLERGAGADPGHGLEIMRAVMDEVDVASSAEGTLVRMRRRIA